MSDSRYISNNLREISPDQAKVFLMKTIENRPIRHHIVAQYAADMRAGRWRVNGEAISFDQDGYLINGHHRLRACVEADMPFETYVVTGLDRELVIESIDNGAGRSSADYLHFVGHKNSALLASTVKAVGNILDRQGKKSKGYQLRPQEPLGCRSVLLSYIRKNPVIEETVTQFVRTLPSVKGICPGAVVTGVVSSLAMVVDRDLAWEFGEQVCTGEGLKKGSPIIRLRKKLVDVARRPGVNLTRAAHMNLLLRTWAFWITDVEMKGLSQATDRGTDIPTIATASTNPNKLYYPAHDNKVRRRKRDE